MPRHLSPLCPLLLILSCGDPIAPRKPPTLMVSPPLLTMPQPMRGVGYAERTFYITNVGEGELALQSIELDEDDNEEELFLELGNEWTAESGPVLAAAESLEVKVI